MNGLTDKLLGLAAALLVVALLVHWAWAILRPLLPLLLIACSAVLVVPYVVRRYRGW